ncbi:MAG: GGDEF domain-containing protein [Deltaproteobacteria bacterium]|nr:GGDEF domain-containing protein [Deltaproteobacteria bacterium]
MAAPGDSGGDDLDRTRVANIDALKEELARRSRRDRAYLIVLAGADVGKMFKLDAGETFLGRSHRATVRIDDDSISRMHAKVLLDGAEIEIEDLGSSNGTLVNEQKITRARLRDGDKIRLGETTILKFTFHDRLDESFQQKMYDAALRDPLTRIYNKKYFIDTLATEFSYARRHGTGLSLIIFDLDHFKRINDTYGHVAGDYVLVELATLVRGMLRNEDVFARYGGEEFVIVLRAIPLHHAGTLAERVRAAVEAKQFVFDGQRLPVTVSVGVAAHHAGLEGFTSLVEEADEALYAAKGAGRNRVLLKYPPDYQPPSG